MMRVFVLTHAVVIHHLIVTKASSEMNFPGRFLTGKKVVYLANKTKSEQTLAKREAKHM